jgi:hypothetical protein
MMINDFLRTLNRFYAVCWSKLFVMWTCLNVVRLVRVPVWTLFVLVKCVRLAGRVSAYPADCVYMCGGLWICAAVWLLWRVNSTKHYPYIKAMCAWSILTEQVCSSCCWLFWLVFGLPSVATDYDEICLVFLRPFRWIPGPRNGPRAIQPLFIFVVHEP